jgi:hypothetical protein
VYMMKGSRTVRACGALPWLSSKACPFGAERAGLGSCVRNLKGAVPASNIDGMRHSEGGSWIRRYCGGRGD